MMASSWIWQQPEWPQFCWSSSALEPLLEKAWASPVFKDSVWITNDVFYKPA
jgi:hypothetical protein